MINYTYVKHHAEQITLNENDRHSVVKGYILGRVTPENKEAGYSCYFKLSPTIEIDLIRAKITHLTTKSAFEAVLKKRNIAIPSDLEITHFGKAPSPEYDPDGFYLGIDLKDGDDEKSAKNIFKKLKDWCMNLK